MPARRSPSAPAGKAQVPDIARSPPAAESSRAVLCRFAWKLLLLAITARKGRAACAWANTKVTGLPLRSDAFILLAIRVGWRHRPGTREASLPRESMGDTCPGPGRFSVAPIAVKRFG